MHSIKRKNELIGKLVKPTSYASAKTKKYFNKNDIGLITRADWDCENRILYVEVLVGKEHFLEREYPSISTFWSFWFEPKPKI